MTRAARARKRKGGAAGTAGLLLVLFLVALLVRSFVVAPFSIPSGSMLPRLMIGDYLFVAKWPYGYSRYALPFGLGHFRGRLLEGSPRRGDIAVFRYPGGGSEDYVKRVIGLPGDKVQMRHGTLWLNGRAVPKVQIADYRMPISPNSPCRTINRDAERTVQDHGRLFCSYSQYRETLPGGRSYEVLDQVGEGPADNTSLVTVPAGHYFVMGDNRDDSEDSRFPVEVGGVGMLPADDLIGRALLTFFSTDGSAQWRDPISWFKAARWNRIGGPF